MRIAYVILHYLAGKDTIECAKSILDATKGSDNETLVIIVDNGSTNDSYRQIQQTFDGNYKVVVLHSDENLGFARGNNLGFAYAKHRFHADFIVQLNNDTIVDQQNVNELIVQMYQEHAYAVLGPDIVTLDGCHQNPGRAVDWTFKKLFMFRTKKKVQYHLAHFSVFDRFLSLNTGAYPKTRIEKEVFDTPLHGACLIFSPLFISRFEGMYDKTFLYMEEDILRLQAVHYGFRMMYTPQIWIVHKEDISTNMLAVSSIEKKKRVYKHLLASSKAYIQLKKQYMKEKRENEEPD